MKRHAAIACAAVMVALPVTANAGLFGNPATSEGHINSCSNVTTNFSYYFTDRLSERKFRGFRGRGTFRIPGETDEAKQPMYNLVELGCHDKEDTRELECTLTEATVSASPGSPSHAMPHRKALRSVDVQLINTQNAQNFWHATLNRSAALEYLLQILPLACPLITIFYHFFNGSRISAYGLPETTPNVRREGSALKLFN